MFERRRTFLTSVVDSREMSASSSGQFNAWEIDPNNRWLCVLVDNGAVHDILEVTKCLDYTRTPTGHYSDRANPAVHVSTQTHQHNCLLLSASSAFMSAGNKNWSADFFSRIDVILMGASSAEKGRELHLTVNDVWNRFSCTIDSGKWIDWKGRMRYDYYVRTDVFMYLSWWDI